MRSILDGTGWVVRIVPASEFRRIHGVPERPAIEKLRRARGARQDAPPRAGVIERGRDALAYEQPGPLAANGPATDSCFSKLIMVARPFALSLVIA
jgi:hypothetical protein